MAPFHPESTLGLGAIELGIFATLLLFGILIPQVYLYYLCNSDRTCVKLLVAAVFILEACHTGAAAQALYCWSAAPTDLLGQPRTISGLSLDIGFETLVTFLVQAYYIDRVYRFSKNAWIGACLFTLCLLRLGGGLALSVASCMKLRDPAYFSLQSRLGWLITAILSVGASVDVFIAMSLCVLVSMTVAICFQSMKNNYVWFGIFVVLGKLYSNSLLASLNSRSLHRKLDSQTRHSFALFSDDSMDGISGDVEFAWSSTGVCPSPAGENSPAPFCLQTPRTPPVVWDQRTLCRVPLSQLTPRQTPGIA
ncbi:hypothetical protein DFH08DRAFT_957778 [Mycena albidolilacea]|uniref:DUF6534 domain-containing protein n=1 Tax=Mycena albidolilacea TaxID=1033008 RepID=A0AAD7A7Y4_9AGAR|nr:hypothetical protein DFH08DRAFT_957778 [Mycena albidolilacea]